MPKTGQLESKIRQKPPAKTSPKLNARQELFCQHLLADKERNAVRAYIAAGYSDKYAQKNATHLTAHNGIQARLRQLEAKALARLQMSQDEVLSETALLARSDMGKFATWGPAGVCYTPSDQLPEGLSRCIKSIKQKVKVIRRQTLKDGTTETHEIQEVELGLHDKGKALEMLARAHGALTDNVNSNVKGKLALEGTLGILTPPPGETPEQWEKRVAQHQQEQEGKAGA